MAREIRFLNEEVGKEIASFTGIKGMPRSLSWSPDSKHVAVVGDFMDKPVFIFEASTGKEVLAYRGHRKEIVADVTEIHAVDWSPDGKMLASCAFDRVVHIWEAASGKRLFEQGGQFSGSSWGLAWSPDGRYLAATHGENGTAHIWDASNGKRIQSYQLNPPERGISIAWSPDSAYLAAGLLDGYVYAWDVKTGKEVFTYWGHGLHTESIAWSPDRKRLAFCRHAISVVQPPQIWEISTRKRLFTPVSTDPTSAYTPWIYTARAVTWSPNGKYLAWAGPNESQIWDASSGEVLLKGKHPPEGATQIAWSPDGKYLALGFLGAVSILLAPQ